MRLTISTLHDLAYEQGHNEGLALDDLTEQDMLDAARIDTGACLVGPATDPIADEVAIEVIA
ncbi:MAG: hypothetical protein JHD16_00160 [Solirubrobacteraceae bacterium]|nr:hypothetical protein [Solirubrobacteraceae bacterium]